MVQASSRLGDGSRIRTIRGDIAEGQITQLLALYRRHPGITDTSISAPLEYSSPASAPSMLGFGGPGPHQESLADTLEATNSDPDPTSWSSLSVHPSALTPGFTGHQELPQLTPSLSGSTDGFEEPYMESGSDIQFLDYAKERAVTWDDLKIGHLCFQEKKVVSGNFLVLSKSFVVSGINAQPDIYLVVGCCESHGLPVTAQNCLATSSLFIVIMYSHSLITLHSFASSSESVPIIHIQD